MKQSKFSILKNSIYLILFSFIFISCEPEEVPEQIDSKNNSVQIFSDTGNEENPPETKKG